MPRSLALPGAIRVAGAGTLVAGAVLLAFFSGGFFGEPRLVALLVACLVLVALLAAGAPAVPLARPGRVALGGLALLCGLVAVGRSWTPAPAAAQDDLERGLLYLVALTAAACAFADRRLARAAEPLVAAGALVVVGAGLLERLVPWLVSFTASQSAQGRLEQPLSYWNATGALAALGFVLAVRVAGDATRDERLRLAAAGATVPLGLAAWLSYSRGALGALVAGVLLLLVLVPTRGQLRATLIAGEGAVAALVVAELLPAVSSFDLTRTDRGAQGAVMAGALVAFVLLATAAQAYCHRAEREGRIATGPLPRVRAVRAAAALLAALIAVLPFALAVGERSRQAGVGARADRLTDAGSNRYAYWRVAARQWSRDPLVGDGPASFRVAWLRERPFAENVRDAHSLPIETAAELGLAGLAALALLGGGLVGCARRVLRDDPGVACGAVAALATWTVFASVDWAWELPGLTLFAILLAGVVLARAPADLPAPVAWRAREPARRPVRRSHGRR